MDLIKYLKERLSVPENWDKYDYRMAKYSFEDVLEICEDVINKNSVIPNVVGQIQQFYCANKDWCGIAKGRNCYKEKCEDWSEKQ